MFVYLEGLTDEVITVQSRGYHPFSHTACFFSLSFKLKADWRMSSVSGFQAISVPMSGISVRVITSLQKRGQKWACRPGVTFPSPINNRDYCSHLAWEWIVPSLTEWVGVCGFLSCVEGVFMLYFDADMYFHLAWCYSTQLPTLSYQEQSFPSTVLLRAQRTTILVVLKILDIMNSARNNSHNSLLTIWN